MRKLLVVLCCILPFIGFAQLGGEDQVYLSGDKVEAKFDGGGIEKFSAFVQEQFDYSKVTKAGNMVASFTVDEEGKVKNIKIIKMIDAASAAEFIRVLNKSPKWQPARRGGKPISIEIKYPMVFKASLATQNRISKTHTYPESEPPKMAMPTNEKLPDDHIYNTVGLEKKPDFPGGMMAFYEFITKNYRMPKTKGLTGSVYVAFVVEKDGSVSDIKVIRDIGHGTGEEAVRVLLKCPKWIPGEQNGKTVRVLYSLPIKLNTTN